MSTEESKRTFQQAAEIFAEALDLPTEKRETYLQKACGENHRLWELALSLLEADQKAERFFQQPLFNVHALVDEPRPEAPPPIPWTPRFPPGTVLAERYRILGLLGKGGMGEVYRAQDLTLRQTVALKFLPSEVELAPNAIGRFLDEARLAREISHPNVCRVYDIGEIDSLRFLSMEYIAGESLAVLFRRIGRVTIEKVSEIGCQIAQGLDAIHRQGVLHRDLKPANLLLDEHGQIRIADFGIALRQSSNSPNEGQRISLVGTPAYMAPEILAGGEASVQSDIYALGLILFEILSGRRPFAGASAPEWLRARQHPPEPALSRLVPTLDHGFESLILQCLEPDPKKRPKSARMLAAALTGPIFSPPQAELQILIAFTPPTIPSQDLVSSLDQAVEKWRLRYRGSNLTPAKSALRLYGFSSVGNALDFCFALRSFEDRNPKLSRRSIALHLAELVLPNHDASRSPKVWSQSLVTQPLLALMEELCGRARTAEILVTKPVFDLIHSRFAPTDSAAKLPGYWSPREPYSVDGSAEPIQLFALKSSDGVSPSGQGQAEAVESWPPKVGRSLPGRHHWFFESPLSQGNSTATWIVQHKKTHERRRVDLWKDPASHPDRKKEVALHQSIRRELGDRHDLVRILDWNFETPPFHIETTYTRDGDLASWLQNQGGLQALTLVRRLDLVRCTAHALEAIHSIHICHGNLQPRSLLIAQGSQGQTVIRLSDLGVPSSSRATNSLLYLAPEQLEGQEPSLSTDLYSLGVLLFQILVGSLDRALAPGWRAEIPDSPLAEIVAALIRREGAQRMSASALVESLDTSLSQSRHSQPSQERFLAKLFKPRSN